MSAPIEFIDLKAQRRRLGERLDAAIRGAIEGGQYILGPQVAEFEKQLAAYVGVKHVVACANGTDALLLPLLASGMRPGRRGLRAELHLRRDGGGGGAGAAEPVFVDIDPDTYNIDIASLEAAIAAIGKEGR
jgi:dTDP-4-amino-4,6-dideoxygalactose transaminase